MDTVYIVLLFLLFIGVSNILARFIPLPLPLLQIALGAVVAIIPDSGAHHISLNPSLFLLLFIPPLLFSDGWHISRRVFAQETGNILMLAMGLVFFTVLGAGYFIHWLVPVIPLPAAFALAAVLSPTDAVALSAITGRLHMPARLMNILRGESLLNDASGLVAFKFAIAAALTGVFVLKDAAVSFVFIAAGGILVGVVLSVLVSWLRYRLIKLKGDLGGAHILMTLLLPFASYIIAEHLNFSGILAAVAAGIMMNYTTFTRGSALQTRIQSIAVWGMLEMVFNGAIFILLGLQLPEILRKAPLDVVEANASSIWVIVWYVLAITIALFILRFVWIWLSLQIIAFKNFVLRRKPGAPITLKLILITSFAGVRGAVTLAAVLSIPLSMGDGSDFPTRNLIIFLAAGTILLSLLGASIGLPFLLKNLNLPVKSKAALEEEMAQVAVAEAGIASMQELMLSPAVQEAEDKDVRIGLCNAVIKFYQLRIAALDTDEAVSAPAMLATQVEKEYQLLAIRNERHEMAKLYEANKISNYTLRRLTQDVDLREGALTGVDIESF